MFDDQKLKQVFENVIGEFNVQVDADNQLTFHQDQKLFGKDGALDSLGLVNLITLLEEQIEDEYDLTITLADERAMSRKTSPFLTVDSLMEYVRERLADTMNE
ncbi:hypothetical protein Dvar_31030 [Desulfosarcina variabilis str. Montpellier]|uniref:hypothetical protein n=1 Tax=Desulfosarcina variabilis TaxID=2300 RepID=UPI003AFAA102